MHMHTAEYLTETAGWIVLMSPKRKGLCRLVMRFLSDSLASVDEPDETDIPPISEAKKLSLTEISTAEDSRVG